MKVVVDDKIPYISEAIESVADEVIYVPGRSFTPEIVKDADVLVVRTRTKCNRELLEGSNVRFIATATIGFDHIDVDYCREAGIEWANCPGCNAGGVEQYVQSALLLLAAKHGRNLADMTIGVVGVGNVGSRVARMAGEMGMRTLLCDPPRAAREGGAGFVPLEQIAAEADVITFHTPLNREGEYCTYHLADARFFDSLSRPVWLFNSSRGEVVCTGDLKKAMAEGKVEDAVIDVWENEPDIDLELLDKVFIGTPHIAGYSADGKANASRMSIENICRFFGLESKVKIEAPKPAEKVVEAGTLAEALIKIYNPLDDCCRLRSNPSSFESLRGNYPVRREKEAFDIVIR